jgi:hypothetical protein
MAVAVVMTIIIVVIVVVAMLVFMLHIIFILGAGIALTNRKLPQNITN